MGAVINVGFRARWLRPVHAGFDDFLDTMIGGPGDAIRYMAARFTVRSGVTYWRAYTLCHLAVLEQVHIELSRQPFVDAFVEQSHAPRKDDS
jgi:hypothetical protein